VQGAGVLHRRHAGASEKVIGAWQFHAITPQPHIEFGHSGHVRELAPKMPQIRFIISSLQNSTKKGVMGGGMA